MVETNPPRNNQPETHPDDDRGRWPERFSPPSDGKISPCLGKLIEMAAAPRHPCCSGMSAINWLLSSAAQFRTPAAVRFVSAIPGRGAAMCVTARQGSRHSRWPAIASTSPWLPCPGVPPAIPARPARLRQRDRAAISTSAQVLLPGDGLALLHRCAMMLPGS